MKRFLPFLLTLALLLTVLPVAALADTDTGEQEESSEGYPSDVAGSPSDINNPDGDGGPVVESEVPEHVPEEPPVDPEANAVPAVRQSDFTLFSNPVTVTSEISFKTALADYANATDDVEITLDVGFSITESLTVPGNSDGCTLTIRSANSNSPVTLMRGSGATGNLFTVASDAHLILEDVVLDGNKGIMSTSRSLVFVSGGELTMRTGAVLRNNTNNDSGPSTGTSGGVCVLESGTFTMEDGEISGNDSLYGGGVYVNTNSTFTMKGGKIIGNTAVYYGGGVFVEGVQADAKSSFTMEGGEISGNTVTDSGNGGGVYVGSDAIVTMEGGKITGNAANSGGGVYITGNVQSSSFTMKDGEIYGNTVDSNGGGVMPSAPLSPSQWKAAKFLTTWPPPMAAGCI